MRGLAALAVTLALASPIFTSPATAAFPALCQNVNGLPVTALPFGYGRVPTGPDIDLSVESAVIQVVGAIRGCDGDGLDRRLGISWRTYNGTQTPDSGLGTNVAHHVSILDLTSMRATTVRMAIGIVAGEDSTEGYAEVGAFSAGHYRAVVEIDPSGLGFERRLEDEDARGNVAYFDFYVQ